MKPLIWSCALLLLVAKTGLAEPPTEGKAAPKDTDVDRMQGTWQLQSVIRDGKAQPAEGVQIIIDENQYTYRDKTGDQDHGTFTLKSAAKPKDPKEMITLRVDAKGQTKAMTRIYTWVDNDTLKFCSPGPAEARPSDFEAPSGSGREVSVWKRQKS